MHVPQSIVNILVFAGISLITSCSSCVEQHDPSKDHALFKEERKTANKEVETLTAEGKIPAAKGDESAVAAKDSKYQTFCASCHGAKGDASGPVAAAMNPVPRNFIDKAWQKSVDDARIAKVIKEGGSSVGLSPTMAPWGAVLSDEDIKVLVEIIRGFNK